MKPMLRKTLAYGAATAVLAAVFTLYMHPAIMVSLADQIWACFQ